MLKQLSISSKAAKLITDNILSIIATIVKLAHLLDLIATGSSAAVGQAAAHCVINLLP